MVVTNRINNNILLSIEIADLKDFKKK